MVVRGNFREGYTKYSKNFMSEDLRFNLEEYRTLEVLVHVGWGYELLRDRNVKIYIFRSVCLSLIAQRIDCVM